MSSGGSNGGMLVKFENKSNRVKGLAFHPQRPWILASLHNGCIQLWDYRMATLIEKFEEHDGPVRGVDFHRTQPLFVSGGDDYKVKVWNYQLKRCLFNLLGHLDYVRTVQFHTECPWILSASDDQTLRIWNWQSRQCLSVLTGHNHYVMCAQFNAKEDLVLSASLDQSVRVWDISGLKKKTVSIQVMPPQQQEQDQGELFGGSDVIVKHVLEGHSRGVNWASFHKTLPLIVSGADDREVKLWRMNERKAWEVDTMRGHVNNVSCVVFHPRKELIISNSEDKSIRVWDMSKAEGPKAFRRQNDRYWILDAHPTLNLLAAGHDTGMIIFKLERERPPMDCSRKEVFYYKDMYIRRYDFKTGQDQPVLSTPGRRTTGGEVAKYLAYNTSNRTQHCLLLTSESDGSSSYELYVVPKNGGNSVGHQSFRGMGRCAVFISRNRFAVLDRQKQLWLKDLKNETKKKITIPDLFVAHIFPGGVGRLLIRTADAMVLYDVQIQKVLAKLPVMHRHPIKYVVWAAKHKYCAMYSKAVIHICDANLVELCSINENSRVKSGTWDACGVFVYTTATHIKYVLPNGDGGIVRTLDTPIYLTSVDGNMLRFVDREAQTGVLEIDPTEYLFKVALVKRKYKDVLRLMKSNKLVGRSIIAYLHKKGFPEVALHFVQDTQMKFNLALECGNIRIALECAQQLDEPEAWYKLGVEALRQGNHQVVEAAYQKTKNFERLSFLYLITGNIGKLNKMMHIAKIRTDMMGRFHNSLYLGNVEERVEVLKEAGQLGLALLTARAHGLEEQTAELMEMLGDKVNDMPDLQADLDAAGLLFPPNPILLESNWPLLEVSKGYFDEPGQEVSSGEEPDSDDDDGPADDMSKPADVDALTAGWGGDMDLGIDVGDDAAGTETKADAGGGWDDNDFGDLGIDLPATASHDEITAGDTFVMPSEGKSASARWQEHSVLAADLIAAGNFDQATHMLSRQIGVVNFEPLKAHCLRIYSGARLHMQLLPGSSASWVTGLERGDGLPLAGFDLPLCLNKLKEGLKMVTDGQLEGAVAHLRTLLQMIPLIVAQKGDENEIAAMVSQCREYITAARLDLERRKSAGKRQLELAAYFTHCKLRPIHLALGLKMAIKAAFGLKNFVTAASFCRRILELLVSSPQKANIAKIVNPQQIKGVLAHCEKAKTNAVELDYEETVHFDVCSASLTAIHRQDTKLACPFCGSLFHNQHDSTVCVTCDLSRVGAEGSGLRNVP